MGTDAVTAATVLAWNVAGRVRTVPEQARVLATHPAAVLALQEVRASALPAWRAALGEVGFDHLAATLSIDGPARPPDRRLGVLVASRSPIALAPALDLPWPERHIAVRTAVDGAEAEVHNLHVPLSSKPDQVKVRTLEAVFAHLAAPSDIPRVLLGDLNTPRYESRDGEVHSFARTRAGNLRPDYGERHDAAELALIVGLREHGFVDAFRFLHGYGRRDRSWLYPNGRTGYRLDHVVVRGLDVTACDYLHPWREQRLSDHAAVWATLRSRQA